MIYGNSARAFLEELGKRIWDVPANLPYFSYELSHEIPTEPGLYYIKYSSGKFMNNQRLVVVYNDPGRIELGISEDGLTAKSLSYFYETYPNILWSSKVFSIE